MVRDMLLLIAIKWMLFDYVYLLNEEIIRLAFLLFGLFSKQTPFGGWYILQYSSKPEGVFFFYFVTLRLISQGERI